MSSIKHYLQLRFKYTNERGDESYKWCIVQYPDQYSLDVSLLSEKFSRECLKFEQQFLVGNIHPIRVMEWKSYGGTISNIGELIIV